MVTVILIIIPERTFHDLYMMCLRLVTRTKEHLLMCIFPFSCCSCCFLVVVNQFGHHRQHNQNSHKSMCFSIFCAISLAPVKLGITCHCEVTQNSPHASWLLNTSRFKFHISLVATLTQVRVFLAQACLLVQTDCDYHYAPEGLRTDSFLRKCLLAFRFPNYQVTKCLFLNEYILFGCISPPLMSDPKISLDCLNKINKHFSSCSLEILLHYNKKSNTSEDYLSFCINFPFAYWKL